MPTYGRPHRQLRALLLAQYVPGLTRCVRCGEAITTRRLSDIHLDHRDDGAGYLGLSHSSCNESAGATKGNLAGPPRGRYARRARRRSRIW